MTEIHVNKTALEECSGELLRLRADMQSVQIPCADTADPVLNRELRALFEQSFVLRESACSLAGATELFLRKVLEKMAAADEGVIPDVK